MAANIVCVTLATAQSVAGPDALTARFGAGSQAAAGVGFGGAAALARQVQEVLSSMSSGPLPISTTQAAPDPPSIMVMDGITKATSAITFTGNGTNGDTVTINGQALTAVNSGATANQWNIGTSTATAAANLIACINASTTASAVRQTVYAYVSPTNSSIVVLSCLFGGVIGNLITVTKSSTSISAVSNLSGGAANTPLTLAH